MRIRRQIARLIGRHARRRDAVPVTPPDSATPAAGAPACLEPHELSLKYGLGPDGLADVLMHGPELTAIVQAIEARPNGSLLVFGCGKDSPFWERVNRGGTTAFVEDDPAWAAQVRTKLAAAAIYPVRYGTRRSQWRELLDDEAGLALELPREVADRRWDVIVVDGPAGFDDERPGRMKSIHAASRLVAPGGRVFVHDCEREVEDQYASRYLGRARLVLEVKGWAVLRGYAF